MQTCESRRDRLSTPGLAVVVDGESACATAPPRTAEVRASGSWDSTTVEQAQHALISVGDVVTGVRAVLARYPDVLLEHPKAIWLRDELARQILERLTGLVGARQADGGRSCPEPLAEQPVRRVRSLTLWVPRPSSPACNVDVDASMEDRHDEPLRTEPTSLSEQEPPVSVDAQEHTEVARLLPSTLEPNEPSPVPPQATPDAASADDAIARRWRALLAREHATAGAFDARTNDIGTARARVYQRRCHVADSSAFATSPADAV